MLKLGSSKTYFYPVTLALLDEEGKSKNFDFDAQFDRLNDDERRELLYRDRDAGDDRPFATDAEIVGRVFKGWRKVHAEDGEQLEVNDANREELLKVEGIKKAIVKAWLKSVGLEGRAKN